MIKINRLSDYAIVLLAQLAKEEGIALTTTQLSEQTALPLAVVRKLMQLLRDADLVQAMQGHKGGYQLKQQPAKITMQAVLTAIQGDLLLTQCAQQEHNCQVQCQYHFEQHWQQINTGINNMLTNISLADMMSTAPLHLSLLNEAKHG